jgi:hypothetical protein
MVTPINAVRCGTGFDEAGRWHEVSLRLARKYEDVDPLAPARGAIWGLLASGLLWTGLILAGRALLGLF